MTNPETGYEKAHRQVEQIAVTMKAIFANVRTGDGRYAYRPASTIKPANQSGLLPAATRNKRLLRSFRSRRMISV